MYCKMDFHGMFDCTDEDGTLVNVTFYVGDKVVVVKNRNGVDDISKSELYEQLFSSSEHNNENKSPEESVLSKQTHNIILYKNMNKNFKSEQDKRIESKKLRDKETRLKMKNRELDE